MNFKRLITYIVLVFIANYGYSQIFQGKGTFKGKISSVDMCDNGTPVNHDKDLNLTEKVADSVVGVQGARCRVRFDGEETEWHGPDTATRTLDISCFYTNADFGNDKDKCGSKAEFSGIAYSSLIIMPEYYKPLWNISIDISFSGEEFLNENVFVRVEAGSDNDESKSITSLILPCDDQGGFSGDSPGEILDMPPGKYTLKIYQPDYAALNVKTDPTKHKAGKIYIKYKVTITGHN